MFCWSAGLIFCQHDSRSSLCHSSCCQQPWLQSLRVHDGRWAIGFKVCLKCVILCRIIKTSLFITLTTLSRCGNHLLWETVVVERCGDFIHWTKSNASRGKFLWQSFIMWLLHWLFHFCTAVSWSCPIQKFLAWPWTARSLEWFHAWNKNIYSRYVYSVEQHIHGKVSLKHMPFPWTQEHKDKETQTIICHHDAFLIQTGKGRYSNFATLHAFQEHLTNLCD